jgi:hypothetical protein
MSSFCRQRSNSSRSMVPERSMSTAWKALRMLMKRPSSFSWKCAIAAARIFSS